NRQSVRSQPGSELSGVQVPIKPRPPIIKKTFVDRLDKLLLFAAHAARHGKNRQDAALMAERAVVITFAEFPPSLDANRAIALKRSIVIFEIKVGSSFSGGDCGDDRDIPHHGA